MGNVEAAQNDQLGFVSEVHNYGIFKLFDGGNAQLALNFFNQGSGSITLGSGQLSISSGFFTQQDNATCYISASGSLSLTNPGTFLGGVLKGISFFFFFSPLLEH